MKTFIDDLVRLLFIAMLILLTSTFLLVTHQQPAGDVTLPPPIEFFDI